jgi:hypothetical protein
MPLTAQDWSVVILGRWNRAILTPSGIARRMFQLDPETPVEVFVAIDAIAPPQVRYDRMVVMVASDRLMIHPEDQTFPRLARAMELGLRGLDSLPETPLAAVGINIKYTCGEPLEVLQDITRSHEWDNRLAENDFVIANRGISRSLSWNGGNINVMIAEGADASFEIRFNFERRSTVLADHQEWLARGVEVIEQEVHHILHNSIQLQPGDIQNAADA